MTTSIQVADLYTSLGVMLYSLLYSEYIPITISAFSIFFMLPLCAIKYLIFLCRTRQSFICVLTAFTGIFFWYGHHWCCYRYCCISVCYLFSHSNKFNIEWQKTALHS